MMHKNKITLLFLILLCVAVAGENDQRRVHVEVRNMLPPTHNFTIHCKSKDDDLGVHIVGLNQVYTFHFQRSILGRTLFFCGLYTEYGHGIYDLYKQTRDAYRCLQCNWGVTRDGVYGYADGTNHSDIFFKWVGP